MVVCSKWLVNGGLGTQIKVYVQEHTNEGSEKRGRSFETLVSN